MTPIRGKSRQSGGKSRQSDSTAVHPDDAKTTLFRDPLASPEEVNTTVMPTDYAAKLLDSADPQADPVTTTTPIPAKKQPAQKQPAQKQPAQKQPAQKQPAQKQPAQKQPAVALEHAVDDYLTFLHEQVEHNATWAKRVLIADYHKHPRLLARVLVALYARSRHIYVYAVIVIRSTLRGGVIQKELLDELDRMPGDDAKIVRFAIDRP